MIVKIILPDELLLEKEVASITLETAYGYITMKPAHIDYLAAVVPGVLSYYDQSQEEKYLAVDQGILVKKGKLVSISLKNAIKGENLNLLKETVEKEFKKLLESEKKARTALEKLEAKFIKGFWEISKA